MSQDKLSIFVEPSLEWKSYNKSRASVCLSLSLSLSLSVRTTLQHHGPSVTPHSGTMGTPSKTHLERLWHPSTLETIFTITEPGVFPKKRNWDTGRTLVSEPYHNLGYTHHHGARSLSQTEQLWHEYQNQRLWYNDDFAGRTSDRNGCDVFDHLSVIGSSYSRQSPLATRRTWDRGMTTNSFEKTTTKNHSPPLKRLRQKITALLLKRLRQKSPDSFKKSLEKNKLFI